MSKPDGGPAFPVLHSIDGNWVKNPLPEYSGMTLRDYFAAAWLMGYVANPSAVDVPRETSANYAYKMADAMLKEREK